MKTNMVQENMKAWENPHLAKMLYNVGTRVKDGLGCHITPSPRNPIAHHHIFPLKCYYVLVSGEDH
jgi:hypothetical protein